jgi:hypothetical protein
MKYNHCSLINRINNLELILNENRIEVKSLFISFENVYVINYQKQVIEITDYFQDRFPCCVFVRLFNKYVKLYD